MSIRQKLLGVVVLATSCVAFAQTTDTKPPDKDTAITSGSAIERAARAAAARNSANQGEIGTFEPMAVLTDTMGVDFNPYLARVLHEVKQNWYALMGFPSPVTKKGKVMIEFFILKDGSVAGLKVVHSSGDVALDRTAYGSITGSNPFPPLPKEFPGPYVGLRLSYICNPTVSISPHVVRMPIGASQQFSATVKATGDTTVNWSISGKGCVGVACGTVSSTGLYTAPATLPDPPRVTVTATLASDQGETATATVEIAKHEEKPSGEPDAAPQKQR
jgi:TonB family protein